MLLEELVSIGFERKEAQKLAESNSFYHIRKTRLELTNLFNKILEVYECGFEEVKRAVLSFPQFAGLDHKRVVRQGVEVYGADNEDRFKKVVLSFPPFAGLDHKRVVRQGIEVYGADNEDRFKRAILVHPQFAGLDHKRVVRQGIEVYGADNEDRFKKVVLSFPPFAGYDHKRVVRQGIEVYGADNEDRFKREILVHPQLAGYDHKRVVRQGIEVYGADNEDRFKRAILVHLPFAGLDHKRVIRQKTRLGRMAGLSNEETINCLLDTSVLASYSAKRYLAAFDIGRQLEREGFPQDEKMLKVFFSYFSKSPYVPDYNRKRISQVVSDKEPPLLKAMRKRLKKS